MAPEEFEPSCETRTSLGENQGSLCSASPSISSFPSRGMGMIKGAHREPHSLVEAHRPHSSEQRRVENERGVLFFRKKLQPIPQAPENELSPQFRVVCSVGKGKEKIRRPEFQLYLGVWFWVSHCTPLNHSVLKGDHTPTLKPPCPASIILPLPFTPVPSWDIQEVPKTSKCRFR